MSSPPAARGRGGRILIAVGYGVFCHAAFVLGVVAMMVAMYFGMSRSLGTLSPPWSWIANAALLVQFPVVHSLLLTGPGRALINRLGPCGTGTILAPTTFVTVASLQVLALFALWSPSGTIWWRAHGVVLAVLVVAYVGAWVLLGKAMFDAGLSVQIGTLGWVALLRGRRPTYPRMPTTGLFRWTRQPIYVAFTLTVWTVPTWTPDQLAVAGTFTLYCLIAPLFKEARFRRIFGSAFDSYARTVPYWLPLPRRPRRPSGRHCEPAAGRARISRRQG
ncbi:isoprenylcysteine carboxylmethyltransferase family protein [Mycobacterium sp. CVI_P3]|uniref:Isoprenylcysteine carboxylmethyltransferase family protein n=1 Tax=Mycobacterium pinniadriaticum TaxID=2994102 RepID=A0ABT3SDL5_9MYCO|nr:isoprenylcysteine carboxylmethyltransferase family protein [Mycobacterium pinniadriaticum]MCX2931168.1 isoprenylcysteine carboxylmethyltransferase family protein [Mycobacterium pinniadriaticum]MCX2937608.1 isoprenylcysteine carboxylmethyltransferase family protein [Mycobacterium pinniadriaticum]